MDKSQIIREIKRIANANGGKPPGRLVFEGETGIKQSDWYPDIWLRWGEALEEAGYEPNKLTGRIEDEVVLQKYISLVRGNCIDFLCSAKSAAKRRATSHFQAIQALIVLVVKKD